MTGTSQDLIAAAARAVAHHGLRKTSLTVVAEEAGVSRATAYRYFGDREHMLQAVGRYEVCTFLRHLEHQVGDERDPRTVVARALDEGLTWMAHHPVVARALRTEADLFVTLFIERPDRSPLFTHLCTEVSETLTRLGHASSFSVPVDNAAEALVRLTFSYLLMPTTTYVDREQVVETLMDGLLGAKGVSEHPTS